MNWVAFFAYAVVTAATPGPNNVMSMSNGARLGFIRTLPFNFGILAGFAVVMTLCTLFCTLLSELVPIIETPMLVIGAGYLLYLAWETWKDDSGSHLESGNQARSGFLQGMLLQFVNPKFYLYCIMSMEAFVLPVYGSDVAMVVLMALLLALIGFLFTLLWSLFGNFIGELFANHAKAVNSVMALLLLGCAASLFL